MLRLLVILPIQPSPPSSLPRKSNIERKVKAKHRRQTRICGIAAGLIALLVPRFAAGADRRFQTMGRDIQQAAVIALVDAKAGAREL
jgi:hypothetical protein